MSINGRIKFFEKSQCLFADGALASVSSGAGSQNYALDRNQYTFWRSVGSDDTITETIEITFSEAKTINRILLTDHNWKEFSVKYDVASVWTNFSNVIGIDGALSGINETTFADDSSYYEFDTVTTTKIQITVLKTQTVDAEKYISQIIATSELGTLTGYPLINSLTHSKNEKLMQALSGRVLNLKSEESFAVNLSFETYPTDATHQVDFDLMFELFDRDTNFLVWLCGGRRGSTYFRYQVRGFRLKDCYEVQTVGTLSPQYMSNVYINPMSMQVSLAEAV